MMSAVILTSSDTQALHQLLAVLTSGALPPTDRPAVIAPPHFLSFISTLAVHPILTNRAKNVDRATAATLSLRYLKIVLHTVGPTKSGLSEAFKFESTTSLARNGRTSRRRTTEENLAKEDSEDIENDLAQAASMWTRGEDFWHVVGWAFNCSVSYNRRWEVWRTWLDYIINVLESDWHLRLSDGQDALSQSMILGFIKGNKASGAEKRILRAVFADGQRRSVYEFREVWRNETRELRKDDDVKKVERRVDIDADDYGDYFEEENEADLAETSSVAASRQSPPAKNSSGGIVNGAEELGGSDALHLRLRLLSLLSHVAVALPRSFIPIRSLYDLYVDQIRPLPLPTFFVIMSPAGLRGFDISAASSITQCILLTIISANAPQPSNDNLSQEVLEACYLPWPARTQNTVDNAKVSLCVETLLRLLDRAGALEGTHALLAAAEKGVQERKAKGRDKKGKRGSTSGGESGEMTWLEGSSQRILAVIKMAIARIARASDDQDNDMHDT